jgi:hypothetical protein
MSGTETIFVPQESQLLFFPLKPWNIAVKSTHINLVFSEIRHENK